MLLKLVSQLNPENYIAQVVSLSGDGPLGEAFRATGLRLDCISSPLGLYDPVRLLKLAVVLRKFNPDIIQGWMYHGNTAASLACYFGGLRAPVFWNVRGSNAVSDDVRLLGRLNHRLSTYLSAGTRWIVNNSLASALQHEAKLGYPADKRVVIPNGFNAQLFKPDEFRRTSMRQALAISSSAIIVGYVGRDHIDKDVSNFMAAARSIAESGWITSEIVFVLAGQSLVDGCRYWEDLDEACRKRFRFLGVVDQVADLLPAFDILVLSSRRENFPNTLGESMCCAVPVVATNVGDCEFLVGDAALIVPPESPEAIRAALLRLIDMGVNERTRLGLKLRQRAIEKFSLDEIVARYQQLYESAVSREQLTCAG